MIAARTPPERPERALTKALQALQLLLVRHGQTEWNATRRVLGRTDIPLDATGEAQAARLRGALPAVHAVYASPLARARQTAAVLGEPRLVPELVEMDQGELDGLDPAGLAEKFGELALRWRADPAGVRLPGGETMDEVRERALTALHRIAGEHGPGETVAVVTHQLVISAVLCHLHGEPLASWRRFNHRNTAWSVVRWTEPPTVLSTDTAPHLEGITEARRHGDTEKQ
jgi:broad specificity phosphatase PhoE